MLIFHPHMQLPMANCYQCMHYGIHSKGTRNNLAMSTLARAVGPADPEVQRHSGGHRLVDGHRGRLRAAVAS